MRQILKDKICFYCLGCNQMENKTFSPKMNCKNFMPSYKDWQSEYYKELKGEK